MTNTFQNYGGVDEPEKKAVVEKNEIDTPGNIDPFEKYKAPTLQSSNLEDRVEPIAEKSVAVKNEVEDKEIVKEAEHQDIDKLLGELNNLVGLSRVKGEIQSLLQFVKIQELRRKKEISTTRPSLHSVFYGSPGTGKTTVARLYAKLLVSMGLLSKGHLVETDRAGLVGGYIGQTAIKTDEKIKEALGGILFIDEAYSLSKGEESAFDYGSEAIAIMLKRMEDYRDDFIVIVAGYPDPMSKFLASNEGLRSRFTTYVHFDDYSPTEMAEIFKRLCVTENYAPTEEASDFVFTAIDYNYSIRDKTFGNARYVRNLFEIVIRNQALRIGNTVDNPSSEELRVILPSDIPFVTPTDTKGNQNPIEKKERGEK